MQNSHATVKGDGSRHGHKILFGVVLQVTISESHRVWALVRARRKLSARYKAREVARLRHESGCHAA